MARMEKIKEKYEKKYFFIYHPFYIRQRVKEILFFGEKFLVIERDGVCSTPVLSLSFPLLV